MYLSIVGNMEEVLKDIEKGNEDAIQASLSLFNSKVLYMYSHFVMAASYPCPIGHNMQCECMGNSMFACNVWLEILVEYLLWQLGTS